MDYRRNLSKGVCEGILGKETYKSVPSIRDTAVVRYGGELHIKYNATSVVVFLPNGDIRLNSGGWRTNTTKSRINAALNGTGWRLWQDAGEWYVGKVGENVKYTFSDGMEVSGE